MNTYLEIAIEIAAAAGVYFFAHKQGRKHQRKKTAQAIAAKPFELIKPRNYITYVERQSRKRKYTPTQKN